MRIVLFLLFSFLFSSVSGQNRTVSIPKYNDGTVSFWYTHIMKQGEELGLLNIEKTSFYFHFRIWTNRQVVEVWIDSNQIKNGQITSWATEKVPENEEPTNRIWVQTKPLNKVQADSVFILIENSHVKEIPSDLELDGWKIIDDGITYSFEASDSNSFVFKKYGNPNSQNLDEAKQIISFLADVFGVCRSTEIWESFFASVPYECFSYGGLYCCSTGNRKMKRLFRKERSRYRKLLDKNGK